MSGTVWSKFFWSDWETDQALKLCSLGAQGLWMRMLCIASAHDPIGYVAVAGRGLNETDLARLTGASESEVLSLLGELDRNGVYSRDRHSRIYSRRMVRDARKAATAKKNGKMGGNPKLCNNTVIPALDNPPDKGGDKPQEPRAKSQTSSLRSDDARKPRSILEGVLDEARAKAVIDHRQRKRSPLTPHAAVLLAKRLSAFASPNEAADRMIERGWQTIEPEWAERLGLKLASKHADNPDWPLNWPMEACREHYLAGRWPAGIGCPPPGQPGCRVPEAIQREWLSAANSPERKIA